MQTSGTALSGFSTLTGKPSLSKITNECPAPIASAFAAARPVSSSSLPDRRTSRADEASQNARPNRRCQAHSGQRFMQVFDSLDEVRLANDDVHVGRLVHGNHFEGHRTRFHELVIPGGMAAAPGCAAMSLSVASGPVPGEARSGHAAAAAACRRAAEGIPGPSAGGPALNRAPCPA